VFRPEYPIRTERLIVRPYEERDLDDLHALTSDPEAVRYLYWEVHTLDETREVLVKRMGQAELTEEGQWLHLAVALGGPDQRNAMGRTGLGAEFDGAVIGNVALRWHSERHRQGEIGFTLRPAFQGKGYAREAAEAMLRLGFEELGLHRIHGACDTRNEPSWRLMERLGMRREAHFVEDEIFKGEFADQYIYAILDREWRARQASSR
jgi:RimJ/RimL family protein N-acetyltransferase